MGAPTLQGPFTMPMFHDFVPRNIQPWIYVFFAFTFQFSGGLYLGNLNHMIGETSLMREDLLMCLYANLAGMAIYFPLLFRMKFRFTNKTLLIAASTGVMICNLAFPHTQILPLMWAICFVEGICKIQGTFECMSNIQLWMTPKRDFTVFFPFLHIIILGSMQLSDILATNLMYFYHWSYMHLFIVGIMMLNLIVLVTCTRHCRTCKTLPLFGIDWLGAVLWSIFLLEVVYLFNYGDWYDWWNSPVMCKLAITTVLTFIVCLFRMLIIRHPYLEPQMWTYRHLLPVLLLITIVEAFLATEHVLEEVFYEEVMHYEEMVSVQLDWFCALGILAGCLFSWWWMHIKHFNYLRLIIVGIIGLICYLIGYYQTISSEIHLSQLYLPTIFRGFAYAILSATFMVCLEEIMSFQHFFQALSVFNMLHMAVGGVIGSAIYTKGLSHYITDNIARYGSYLDHTAHTLGDVPEFMEQFMSYIIEISIKQIYGWTSYACVLLLLLFLLYDMPIRRRLKPMPIWKNVRHDVTTSLRKTIEKYRARRTKRRII